MASFLNTVFTGAPGKYEIFGVECVFPESPAKKTHSRNSLSDIAHLCFTRGFSCVTLKDPMRFVKLMEGLMACKIHGCIAKLNKLSFKGRIMGLSPKFSPGFDRENSNLSKVMGLVQAISKILLFITAKAIAAYITKPVAVVLAASAIYWSAHEILFSLGHNNKLDNESYGWKGKTALVATYALAVFAASQLI